MLNLFEGRVWRWGNAGSTGWPQKKQSPSEISITLPKMKILGFVEDIFLHMTVKFHVKGITRSKVMKVLAKSLKNATNNIINYFKPVEILAFNF